MDGKRKAWKGIAKKLTPSPQADPTRTLARASALRSRDASIHQTALRAVAFTHPIDHNPRHIAHHHYSGDLTREGRSADYVHYRVERDGERHQAGEQAAAGRHLEPHGQA